MKIKVANLTDAYFELNNYLFMNEAYDYVRNGVTAHKFHVQLECASATCDLHMHQVNYTPSKWKMLTNLYLNQEELGIMIARLLHYRDESSHSKKYIPDIGMNFKSRRNVSGSCLLAITIGYNQTYGWHCEVFSRASELTMRWYVDLIFIHVLIREIGKVVGFKPEQVRVFWTMASTYQSITSMPWFLILNGQEEYLKQPLDSFKEKSWAWWTAKRYNKCFVNTGYTSFKVQRRPVEAYRMLKGEIPYKQIVRTENLVLPNFNIPELVEWAQNNDTFGKGGYR